MTSDKLASRAFIFMLAAVAIGCFFVLLISSPQQAIELFLFSIAGTMVMLAVLGLSILIGAIFGED